MTLDDLSLFAPTAPERITLPSARLEAAALPWQPHPTFPGVHMKHLVLGADTGGALSCHLVRVAPGAALGEHDHPAQIEVHKVLGGAGLCRCAGADIAYAPGDLAVIPPGRRHSVAAGEPGLLLLAQFCPALK